jgi:hypothetical protein
LQGYQSSPPPPVVEEAVFVVLAVPLAPPALVAVALLVTVPLLAPLALPSPVAVLALLELCAPSLVAGSPVVVDAVTPLVLLVIAALEVVALAVVLLDVGPRLELAVRSPVAPLLTAVPPAPVAELPSLGLAPPSPLLLQPAKHSEMVASRSALALPNPTKSASDRSSTLRACMQFDSATSVH